MAEVTYRCKVAPCTNLKEKTNHWFVVIDVSTKRRRKLVIQDFNEAAIQSRGALEICSESCLHIFLSRWNTRKKNEASSPKPEAVEPAEKPEV